MRRATDSTENVVRLCEISIHALHEESDTEVAIAPDTAATISIHALHEESDVTHFAIVGADIISIHALHEESDCALLTIR